MTTMTEQETRHLPTGTWIRVGDDEWAKLCRKCGGSGYLPGYEFIDGARCWGCMRSGWDGCKNLSTAALDRKAVADAKRAASREAKREAERLLRVEEWKQAEAKREAEEAAEEAKAQAERAARIAAARHLDAAEGSKVTVSGTVTVAHTYEAVSYGGWGTEMKRIVAVDLGDGVTVKMFTTAGWAFQVSKSDEVTIAATVKKHDHHEGVAETLLTRPRLTTHTPKEPTDG